MTLWPFEEEPKYNGIDGVNPADMIDAESMPTTVERVVVEPAEKKIPEHLQKREGQYGCRVCGRLFDYPIARAGHEKKCRKMSKEAAANG